MRTCRRITSPEGVGCRSRIVVAAYLAAVGYLFVFQRDYVFEPGGDARRAGRERASPASRSSTLDARGRHDADRLVSPSRARHADGALFPRQCRQPLRAAPTASGRSLASGFGLLAMSYRGYRRQRRQPERGGALLRCAGDLRLAGGAHRRHRRLRRVARHRRSRPTSPPSGRRARSSSRRRSRPRSTSPPRPIPGCRSSLLMRDPFLSREHIRRVEEPVLIVHGTADAVVPVEHGRRLFEVGATSRRRSPSSTAPATATSGSAASGRSCSTFLRRSGVVGQPARPVVRRMPSFAG